MLVEGVRRMLGDIMLHFRGALAVYCVLYTIYYDVIYVPNLYYLLYVCIYVCRIYTEAQIKVALC